MNEIAADGSSEFVELTSSVVSAYVTKNTIGAADLPKLIVDVYQAFADLGVPAAPVLVEPPRPAVSIRKSLTPDYLICLEDGKKFKSLKRHLRVTHNVTPEAYRGKWGLPSDYPMVAPIYSAARSMLAKSTGLGRKAAAARTSKKRGSAAT